MMFKFLRKPELDSRMRVHRYHYQISEFTSGKEITTGSFFEVVNFILSLSDLLETTRAHMVIVLSSMRPDQPVPYFDGDTVLKMTMIDRFPGVK